MTSIHMLNIETLNLIEFVPYKFKHLRFLLFGVSEVASNCYNKNAPALDINISKIGNIVFKLC